MKLPDANLQVYKTKNLSHIFVHAFCLHFIRTHQDYFFQKSFTLQHGCSPINLLHIFRTPFHETTSGWLRPYNVQVYFEAFLCHKQALVEQALVLVTQS